MENLNEKFLVDFRCGSDCETRLLCREGHPSKFKLQAPARRHTSDAFTVLRRILTVNTANFQTTYKAAKNEEAAFQPTRLT